MQKIQGTNKIIANYNKLIKKIPGKQNVLPQRMQTVTADVINLRKTKKHSQFQINFSEKSQ